MMYVSDEILYALVAIILANCFYFYYTKIYKLAKFTKQFPSPPGNFFLGVAKDFTSTSAFFKSLHRYTKNHGSMVHLSGGPLAHGLLCSDPNFIQFVLNNNKSFTKSPNLKFLKPWIGLGLVVLEGDVWKKHRRLITPAFHFKILERFIDIFESASDILVEKLGSGSQSVDIHPYITRCTLDIICETAMGTKIDAQNNEKSAYLQSVRDMCRIFIVRTMSPLKSNDLFYIFTEDYKIQKRSLKHLHGQTQQVLETKSQALKDKVDDDKKKKVFIDIMLEASANGQELSEREIRDEVNTFMFGGHDTTAAGTSFVLYCLANNKEAQDRVLEEQKQIFGTTKNPKVTYSNLQEMRYLEMAIKESMRLYSPVPFFGRQACEDVEYEGTIIPKGLPILIFSGGLHINPKYYPDPEKFDPSRFENTEGKHPFSYIPFSAGPRNCIGQKYAMLEMKCLVSKIVRNFELTPADPPHDMELAAETVLKSLNGVKIGFKKR